ncbi:putative dsRNA-binding protein [Pseudonocardia lacus]|uniref:putative dsRNA-binding protein n=1 Tax=Pseudonocardia lacus TaxID=2835865 RepID=UPI001BDC22D2|nr:putative dsRNA-binding protein [Pseudonocardia lacus]
MTGEPDKRLVQTAVVDAATSRTPVIMPMTRFEARQMLDGSPGASFWCGTWLGGCGTRLTTRVGMERIPHFAHRPARNGQHTACHRQHNDRRSADHLFVDRDLTIWARRHSDRPAVPVLHGEFSRGGTCTCLELALRTEAGDGLITVVFKAYDMSVWYTGGLVEPSTAGWRNWVFGPGVASPQQVLDRDGFALHLRLDSTDAAASVEIGTRPPSGGIEWVSLDDCTVDERGISTPFVADLRRRRTVIIMSPRRAAESAERLSTGAGGTALVDLDEALDTIPLRERLVDFFAETGAPLYDDHHLQRWLRAASAHSSYLYEKGLSRIVAPSVLHGLAELAKRHVRAAVLDRYIAANHPAKVGQQSSALAAHERSAWDALAALPAVEDSLHFGKGEAQQLAQRPTRSRLAVVQQVIGLAGLVGGHAAVRRLVDRAVTESAAASEPETVADWRTTLDQLVPHEDQVWEWNRSGPDHEPRFEAVLRVRDWTARGSGPSKKAASRAAAEDFVRRWLPAVTSTTIRAHNSHP